MNNKEKTGDYDDLRSLFPWRRKVGGRKPGMRNKEITGKKKGTEITWVFPRREATEKQLGKLIARTVEIGLRTVWENFVYSFGGKFYLQAQGGPIGARITMAASRIVMFDWAVQYRSMLEDICLWSPLLIGYVDDVRQFTSPAEPGTRFNEITKKFEITEENKILDVESKTPMEKIMQSEYKKAMNSINPDVKFTIESAEDFPQYNCRLPTLDTLVWVDESGKTQHSYFQKPMKSPYLLMEPSAMSEHQKMSILSNELIRRMGNISQEIKIEEKCGVIEGFIKEMKNSGYWRKIVRDAVISGLKGHKNRYEHRLKNFGSYYRTSKQTLSKRNWKKLT